MDGLSVGTVEGEPFLFVDKKGNTGAEEFYDMLHHWSLEAAKLEKGEITGEEYACWCYRDKA